MGSCKRILASAVFALLVLAQGCGGRGPGGPVPLGDARKALETPLAAAAFVDSVGVNLHMTYGGTPYDYGFVTWGPILRASGIKHVRDGVCPHEIAWCKVLVPQRLKQLAASGIHLDLQTSMADSPDYASTYVQKMHLESVVDAIEGPNECDSGLYCVGNWQTVERGWQEMLYSLKTPGVTIVGPSMVSKKGYASLGDLSNFMDVGNVHDYVGADAPETDEGLSDKLSWTGAMSESKPLWATEMGYSTDLRYGHSGVPPIVQERYIPRMLFDHLRRGIMRSYIYQLFDYGPDGGEFMGLLNADYSPKPAWTRLEQLIAAFKDDGTSPQTPLNYAIQNDPSGTLHHLLFQRADGTYLLVLWLANSAYDTKTQAVLQPKGEAVGIALPENVKAATQTKYLDNGVTSELPVDVTGGSLSVTVSSQISILKFKV